MSLFGGLERFGLKVKDTDNLYEEKKEVKKEPQAPVKPEVKPEVKKEVKAEAKTEKKTEAEPKKPEVPTEESLLFDKTFNCPVCDHSFKSKVVKSGKARRLEPDKDLRPRFMHIDTIKYDVVSCPFCGYTAITRYFDHLSSVQIKLIKEQISANFIPSGSVEARVLDYDTAIDYYKMALYSSTVKNSKSSEKAYACLKIAWLYRGKLETLDVTDAGTIQARKECEEEGENFYRQAYEGFMKSISSEMYPICGMDQNTLDYLLGVMAAHFKEYDFASRCISGILTSATASKKMKDYAYDMKEQILAERAEYKENEGNHE